MRYMGLKSSAFGQSTASLFSLHPLVPHNLNLNFSPEKPAMKRLPTLIMPIKSTGIEEHAVFCLICSLLFRTCVPNPQIPMQ